MIKKTMVYTDYDGNERTEDHWFNLTQAEAAKMELGTTGGISKMIERIVQEQDSKRMLDVFDDFIKCSYGKKSLDGKRFVKTPEQTAEFMQTQAYSDLFIEFMNNPDVASKFVAGVLNINTNAAPAAPVAAEAGAPALVLVNEPTAN